MNYFRKTLAVLLAAFLLHAPVAPAAAAFKAAPRTSAAPRALVAPKLSPLAGAPKLSVLKGASVSRIPQAAPAKAPEAPQAKTSLQQIAGAVSHKNAGTALNSRYDGQKKPAGGGEDLSVAGKEGSNDGSGLKAREVRSQASKRSSIPSPSLLKSQSGKANTTMMIVAGVVAAVAITLGVLWNNGSNKNARWQSSQASHDVVAIERARQTGDADALVALAKTARERQVRGDKTQRAFDGLAAARGELNLNAVSSDPGQRIGAQPPSAWQARLSQEEPSAKKSGFEGALALQLQAMSAELGRQNSLNKGLEADLKTFEDYVPSTFGGDLKAEAKKGRQDLNEFKSNELSAEQSAFDRANGSMRGRVSDKLAAASAEFAGRKARLDRLASAADQIKPSVEVARQIDKDLREMGEHERSRAYHMQMAAQAEMNDAHSKDDVDSGAHFRAMAASAGAAARASAASAQAGIRALHVILPLLRGDKTLQQENLVFALPSGPGTNVSSNGSVFFDFWMPATWNVFGMMFSESQASQARASFSPVLAALQQVQAEIASRQGAESSRVNEAIDQYLAKQMAQAQKTVKP